MASSNQASNAPDGIVVELHASTVEHSNCASSDLIHSLGTLSDGSPNPTFRQGGLASSLAATRTVGTTCAAASESTHFASSEPTPRSLRPFRTAQVRTSTYDDDDEVLLSTSRKVSAPSNGCSPRSYKLPVPGSNAAVKQLVPCTIVSCTKSTERRRWSFLLFPLPLALPVLLTCTCTIDGEIGQLRASALRVVKQREGRDESAIRRPRARTALMHARLRRKYKAAALPCATRWDAPLHAYTQARSDDRRCRRTARTGAGRPSRRRRLRRAPSAVIWDPPRR